MKTIAVLLLSFLFVGCSTVSDYNQGCQDAVKGLGIGARPDFVPKFCDELEARRKTEKEPREGKLQ